ncbi:MAG: radical SAM protein, partial [Bacteroidaceae bacterium]|nr:radical SAM protein [Bacteroidaceae bacterium]
MEYTREILLGKSLAELKMIVGELGLPGFTAKQIMQWIYEKGVADIGEMTNLSLNAREVIAKRFDIGYMPHVSRQCSVDGTIKYLFPTSIEDETVECVYIPDGERATLCVSSQVGCRMGCRFCMTGRQGFRGNLTAGDILNQVYALPERDSLTNIVFMGQGEPLDNMDAVLRATELLMDPMGWAWSPKRITVSTVGVRSGLQRFIEESPCHLAVSLHNPFPLERKEMMPAENGYSIAELIPLLMQYDWSHQRRVSFEYIVFTGINDS